MKINLLNLRNYLKDTSFNLNNVLAKGHCKKNIYIYMNIFGYLDHLRVFLFYNFENLLFGYLVIYFNDLF